MCFGPLKYTSGLGLASQAIKGGPISLISPAAGVVSSLTKKKPASPAPSNFTPYGG